MNTNRLLIVFGLSILLVPFVLGADFSLSCPANVGDDAFTCTLDFTDMDANDFGGFDFTVETDGFMVDGRPSTDWGSIQFHTDTDSGSLLYDYSGVDASGTLVSLNFVKADGIGDSGTVILTGLLYYNIVGDGLEIADVSAEILTGAAEDVEEAEPEPEEEEDVEEEEAEPEEDRTPLTAEDLADDADADGDGETNAEDDDDDGDGVADDEDTCNNTFIGAERVAGDGCLVGDVVIEDEVPDGCVNGEDLDAVNFLSMLFEDGLASLSNFLWGMYGNWNAGLGSC